MVFTVQMSNIVLISTRFGSLHFVLIGIHTISTLVAKILVTFHSWMVDSSCYHGNDSAIIPSVKTLHSTSNSSFVSILFSYKSVGMLRHCSSFNLQQLLCFYTFFLINLVECWGTTLHSTSNSSFVSILFSYKSVGMLRHYSSFNLQ